VKIGFIKEHTLEGKTRKNLFYVRENGIGIHKDSHEKTFRLFSRLNKESAYGPGTGAGLSFVKKIVEDHGGKSSLLPMRVEERHSIFRSLAMKESKLST
jgi:light-regulated signal transduction histidine kinase (bacteriophytochrome)